MTAARRILIPYGPRAQQAVVHDDPRRFKTLVSHRRFGKTVLAVNHLIKKAAQNKRVSPPPRYAYVAPYLVQAKDIAWGYLKHYAAPIPGLTVNESELWVELPGERRIRLYGADNADRLRGLYFDGAVRDEPAQMAPRVWSEILRPCLADYEGWGLSIGTPMGRNAFSEEYDLGQAGTDPDWASFMFKASQTGIIPADELKAAQRAMTADQYAQEFECSFDAAIPGAYYAEILSTAEQMGRIKPVPWEPALPVYTAWDLGINDPTAIWFCQFAHGEPRLIDYYEEGGRGLDYHVTQLRAGHRNEWVYGQHFFPHDVKVKELGSGMSRVDTLKGFGLHPTVLPASSVDDGISQAKFLIRKMWFDSARCAAGLKMLRQYRSEWDEKRQVLRPTPLHDFTSHCADAFRYLAVGLGSHMIAGKPLGDPALSEITRAGASLQRTARGVGGGGKKPFGWRT